MSGLTTIGIIAILVLIGIYVVIKMVQWHPNEDSRNAILFKKYYERLLSLLANSELSHNAQFELLPLLFSVGSLSLGYTGESSANYYNDIQSFVTRKCSAEQLSTFSERKVFYSNIAKWGTLRGEWAAGDIPYELASSSLNRVLVSFGDIIVNPDCASDYKNAPRVLLSINDKAKFSLMFSNQFVPLIMEYCVSLVTDTDYNFVH